MSFELEKILQSKRNLRKQLAARSIAEKLRMLDALRERALTLAKNRAEKPVLSEPAVGYRISPRGKKQR